MTLSLAFGVGGCLIGALIFRGLTNRAGRPISGVDSTVPQSAAAPTSADDTAQHRRQGEAPSVRDASGKRAAESEEVPVARRVVVNGERLTEEQIRLLESIYHAAVRTGDYWYDRLCGAWGFVGGPTAGIMHAGMNLGGPLRPDASGGRTGIFINGREIHPLDRAALMMIYPAVQRGRVWLDAWGNWGPEGGPAFDNLWAAAARAGGGGGGGGQAKPGILSGYDKTGIAVYGY